MSAMEILWAVLIIVAAIPGFLFISLFVLALFGCAIQGGCEIVVMFYRWLRNPKQPWGADE